MFRKYSIFIFSLIIGLTSCVSKKKYLEMESGRLKAEELARQLDEENNAKAARIEALIADFESMKNELMESNVIKDQYIDSLSGEIFALQEKLNQEKESLQQTSFNLDFEQKRLTSALEAKDKTINSLTSRVSEMERQVASQRTTIETKNLNLAQLVEQTQILQGKISAGETRVQKLQTDLEKVKAETQRLIDQIKEKDAVIQRLENNVKLLKSELGN